MCVCVCVDFIPPVGFPLITQKYTQNTQIGCTDSFELTMKNLTMEDIKVIFKKMLKEHKASIVQKNQETFHKQEQSILALISGNNALTNLCLDNLSKDINDLKES